MTARLCSVRSSWSPVPVYGTFLLCVLVEEEGGGVPGKLSIPIKQESGSVVLMVDTKGVCTIQSSVMFH